MRLRALDALRFLAAACVLVFHYGFRGYAADGLTRMPPSSVFDGWAKYGYLGVELFFLISGFVILMSASRASARGFLVARVVRLYPAFWACCAVSAAVAWYVGSSAFAVSLPEFLQNLTLLSGLWGVRHVDGVYWSLVVELKFYGLVLLLLAFRQMPRVEAWLWAWLVAALLAKAGYAPFRWGWWLLQPDHAPYFIGGAAAYLVHHRGWSLSRGCMWLFACCFGIVQANARLNDMVAHYQQAFSPWVIAVLVGNCFCLMLVLKVMEPLFKSPLWPWLGALSYPVYLLHQNIGMMIFDEVHPAVPHGIAFGLALVTTGCLAWLVHVVVERPLAPPFRRGLTRLLSGRRGSLGAA